MLPRWFRVIRWREMGERFIFNQKMNFFTVYLPIFSCIFLIEDAYSYHLWLKRPKTDEERLKIKRDQMENPFMRNWEIGQYHNDRPPLYDLSQRRQSQN